MLGNMEGEGLGEVTKAITAESALMLLHAKGKERILVNVKAVVRCASEIIRIKQVQIFLVQLLPGLNIFVKEKQFMRWHKDICPQKSYIFTKLQPTTLKKGCKSQHYVYTVTRHSRLKLAEELDDILILNKEEWLQHCGIHKEDVQFTEEIFQTEEPDSKLVSYQGIVTKILDGVLGVFELDNRVRLYVSTVPALHKYSFIKEGSCITLYNVHCLVAKEAPKIRLYCCMLSVIKPEKEMNAASSKTLVPQAQLQKLLYFYGVTISQLNWLYTTRDSLFQHFTEACEKRDVEKMFSVLLSSPRLSWQQETTENRNLLDEFLSPSHTCCLSSESQMSSTSLPCLTTVSRLKHDVESNNVFITKPNEYWQFEREEYCNEQLLIGILGSDLKTGHSKLYDNTGYIRAVIADSHGNQQLKCRDNCCCDTIQEGDNFPCPSLHTCCMGKIVAIYRYSVAMETFVSDVTTSCDTASTSRGDKKHSILYIEFSMTDAVMLGNTATIGKGSKNEHKTAMVNGELYTCALRSAHEQKAAVMINPELNTSALKTLGKGSKNEHKRAMVNGESNTCALRIAREQKAAVMNGESNTCALRSAHEQKAAMVNDESNTCALRLRSAHEQKAAVINSELNTSALRMAKTQKSFGHSECTSVNTNRSESASTEQNVANDKAVVVISDDSNSYHDDSVRNNSKRVARTKNEDCSVRLTYNVVQQTDNALQKTDNTVQKTDNALKITDNDVQKKDNTVQKKDNAVQVTVNAVKKTDNCVRKTDNCVLKTDNALKITDNDVRKTDNCGQKTDNAVHIDDNAVQKTNALHIADKSIHASCDTEQKSDNPVQRINNPVHKSVNGVHITNNNVHVASNTVQKAENAVQKMESKLHRHVNEENVSYFCRKANCIKQTEREKSLSVLSVKPISQKRKSVIVIESNSNHSTDSTAHMVVKKIKRDVSSKKRSVGEINTTTDPVSNADIDSIATASKAWPDTLPCKEHFFTGMKQIKAWGEKGSLVKVNSREALIFVSASQDGVALMFHVQGQIWKNDKFEPEQVIIFKNKAVDWYPFLRPNCLYQFSLDNELSPLFKGALADTKLVRAVERSKTKKCVLVHAEVKIEQVFRGPSNAVEGTLGLTPISEILESERKFVSLKGLIVNRTHSDPEPMKGRSLRNIQQCSNTMDWSKFQISTPQNRCIRLQVQDLESGAEITVFLNLAGMVYPLGLIPGATVVFLNLDRKVSRMGNVYCRFIASSSMLVIGISHSSANINKLKPATDPGVERDIDKIFPKLKLIDLWRSKTEVKEFQCVCDILQVTKISLKCVCDLCGSTVVQSDCPSAGCHLENGTKFVTRASYIVDDGSSVAIVTLTGSDLMKLLGLSHDQWLCLEEETRNHGEVFIQQTRPAYGSALEKFVYMLCDNSQLKKPWMMSFKTKQYNSFNRRSVIDLDTLSLDEFALKSIDTGSGQISTRCIPFLQLECICLAEVDPTEWALHSLNSK